MKFLKSWGIPFVVACALAFLINTFAFSFVKVEAKVLNDYPKNSKLLINKLKTEYNIGDIVVAKHDGTNVLRKIYSVDNNTIVLTDDSGNQITVNGNDIIGVKF